MKIKKFTRSPLPKGQRREKNRVDYLSLRKLIPNILTFMALIAGLTSIRLALLAKWEWALGCIFIAVLLDGLDGRIARLLGATSRFGAELDSLADACNFGVAPAVIIYLYTGHELKAMGWGASLFYVVCMVARLARFNALLYEDGPRKLSGPFFMGVPAPMGAFLALTPMMLGFELDIIFSGYFYCPYLIGVAFLLISRFPTFSLKGGSIPRKWAFTIFIALGVMGIALVSAPWTTLALFSLLYAASFPLSYRKEKSQRCPGEASGGGSSGGSSASFAAPGSAPGPASRQD
jgi:CDP-diacylglycerol--serine O-phosphatidyltransferase